MTATTFDTLMHAKKLREAGVPERQAEIQAEALRALEVKIDEISHVGNEITRITKLEDGINKLGVSVAKIEATLPSLATKAEVANSTKAIIISLILLLGGSTVFERLFPPTVNIQPNISHQTLK
jgi:hypothetical protein